MRLKTSAGLCIIKEQFHRSQALQRPTITVQYPLHRQSPTGLLAILLLLMAGCASDPITQPAKVSGKAVCDSYIILDMCVEDLVGDGSVDMIYFSDTREIFMYRDGMKNAVAGEMPFHRCAVPLNSGMQSITNRILKRNPDKRVLLCDIP